MGELNPPAGPGTCPPAAGEGDRSGTGTDQEWEHGHYLDDYRGAMNEDPIIPEWPCSGC